MKATPPLSIKDTVAVYRQKYPEGLVCVDCGLLLATLAKSYAKSNLTEVQRLAYVCKECRQEKAQVERVKAVRIKNLSSKTEGVLCAQTGQAKWHSLSSRPASDCLVGGRHTPGSEAEAECPLRAAHHPASQSTRWVKYAWRGMHSAPECLCKRLICSLCHPSKRQSSSSGEILIAADELMYQADQITGASPSMTTAALRAALDTTIEAQTLTQNQKEKLNEHRTAAIKPKRVPNSGSGRGGIRRLEGGRGLVARSIGDALHPSGQQAVGSPRGDVSRLVKTAGGFQAATGRKGHLANSGGSLGSQAPGWKGRSVGYSGAHERVESIYGKASEHLCLQCGSPASHWALNPSAANFKVARKGNVAGEAYSLNPDDYRPLCRSCNYREGQPWHSNRSSQVLKPLSRVFPGSPGLSRDHAVGPVSQGGFAGKGAKRAKAEVS